MNENSLDSIEQSHRQAAARHPAVQPHPEPATIHYSQLQDLPPDSPIRQEWNTYRRELPRLLAEGLEGKFALVKGEEVVAVFSTWEDGVRAGRERYGMRPFMVQPIREFEPLMRIRGHSIPCRGSTLPSATMR
jgi:hypothetical protein